MTAQAETAIVYDAVGDTALDLQRLTQLKAQKAELEEEIAFIQASLMKDIEGPTRFFINDEEYRATTVSSETFDVDLATLKTIDPDLYRGVTKSVLDNAAFKRAVESGAINPAVAQKVVAIKPRASYIKLTKYTPKEEDSE